MEDRIKKSAIYKEGHELSPEFIEALNAFTKAMEKEGFVSDVDESSDYLRLTLGPTFVSVYHYTY